jgi:hypothetical protein
MTIFSRRAIQKNLNALKNTLSSGDLVRLVKRLNQPGRDRLAASWEVCLLQAFNAIGHLSYELPVTDGHRPDVSFRYHDKNKPGFVADITAISDDGLHTANPFLEFSQQLHALAMDVGLGPNSLNIDVGGRQDGAFGFQKTRLLLPKKDDIPHFLSTKIKPFLLSIRDRDVNRDAITIEADGISLTIQYDADRQYAGGHYPSYEATYSLKKNPLWNQLRNKASQLKGASEKSKVGIIVCDGGCHLLQSRYRGHSTFVSQDVIRQFYNETPFISFIVCLMAQREEMANHTYRYQLRSEIYIENTESNNQTLRDCLQLAISNLPRPIMDSYNAYYRARETGYEMGHHGGHSMNGRSVRISSRELQELLSGRRTIADFNRAHEWRMPTDSGNKQISPFERSLIEGRLIKNMRIETDENDNDDWITFEFGRPDPAISPFTVPAKDAT